MDNVAWWSFLRAIEPIIDIGILVAVVFIYKILYDIKQALKKQQT